MKKKRIYASAVFILLVFIYLISPGVQSSLTGSYVLPHHNIQYIIVNNGDNSAIPLARQNKWGVNFDFGLTPYLNPAFKNLIRFFFCWSGFSIIIFVTDLRKNVFKFILSYFNGSKYKGGISFS